MIDFIYYGEVNLAQEELTDILKLGEMLMIKGLAELPKNSIRTNNNETHFNHISAPGPMLPQDLPMIPGMVNFDDNANENLPNNFPMQSGTAAANVKKRKRNLKSKSCSMIYTFNQLFINRFIHSHSSKSSCSSAVRESSARCVKYRLSGQPKRSIVRWSVTRCFVPTRNFDSHRSDSIPISAINY